MKDEWFHHQGYMGKSRNTMGISKQHYAFWINDDKWEVNRGEVISLLGILNQHFFGNIVLININGNISNKEYIQEIYDGSSKFITLWYTNITMESNRF